MEDKIVEIERDIESYREAIANAEGALDEAERELEEELEKRFGNRDIPEDHPVE